MQTQNHTTPQNQFPGWQAVLTALHQVKTFVAIEELTKLADLEEPIVMNCLTFLHNQSWVQCSQDGSRWACTPETNVIMDSISKGFARIQ